MGIDGWTLVYNDYVRGMASLIAAVLNARGIEAKVVGRGRVMVPDDQADTALRIIREADEPQPDR